MAATLLDYYPTSDLRTIPPFTLAGPSPLLRISSLTPVPDGIISKPSTLTRKLPQIRFENFQRPQFPVPLPILSPSSVTPVPEVD